MNQVQLSIAVTRLIVGLIDACWDNKIIASRSAIMHDRIWY